jgi:hypothetical protein
MIPFLAGPTVAVLLIYAPDPLTVLRSDAVVKILASASPSDSSGKQALTITLVHEKGWHTYANPIGNPEFDNNKTVVTVYCEGKPIGARVEYPPGTVIKSSVIGDYRVYENKVKIKVLVPRAPCVSNPLEVRVRIVACHEKGACLPVATVKVRVP